MQRQEENAMNVCEIEGCTHQAVEMVNEIALCEWCVLSLAVRRSDHSIALEAVIARHFSVWLV